MPEDTSLKPEIDNAVDPFAFARRLRTPIWVYDTDRQCIAYANKPGCKLWKAEDEGALKSRDFSDGMSITVADRLRQYQSDFKDGETEFSETWTIHPDGEQPVTVDVIYTGFPMPGGRMAMMCEAIGKADPVSETLRSTKALLHTDIIIALYSVDGQPLYKNPAARSALPISESSLDEIFVACRDLEEFQADWQKNGEGRRVAKIKTAAGERWLDLKVEQCLDAVTGEQALLVTAFDVTELKEVKAESELRQEQLEATFSASLDGIIIIDTKGKILEFNESSQRIFGHAKEDILGKNIDLIIPERYQAAHKNGMSRMLASGKTRIQGQRIEIEALRANGEEFMSELAVSRSRSSNGDIFTAYFRDISAAKATEKALLDAKNAAESANNAKSQFLANMSHEIRTPMNGVLGMLEVLRATKLNEKQLNYTDVILRSGNSLLSILSDILDFSKIEAGKLSINSEPCNLEETMRDVARLFDASASEKRLTLNFEYAPELPKYFIADADRIRQIVSNLVGNAIKFTHEGAITVCVFGDIKNGYADISINVKDTGIGISPDKMALIFEKFTQAESSTTRNYGGTGLGLAISRQLAVAMNGQLDVRSNQGPGTTFTLQLPLKVSAAPEIEVPLSKTITSTVPIVPQNGSETFEDIRLNFLVIGDDEISKDIITKNFKHPRINILFSQKGVPVSEAVKKQKFDVIFMDMSVLGIIDTESTQIIRENELQKGQARTPIIYLTPEGMNESRLEFLHANMDDHISKPLQKDQLHKAVSKWLRAAKAVSRKKAESIYY